MNNYKNICVLITMASLMLGCSSVEELPSSSIPTLSKDAEGAYQYRIGTGDLLSIFVWRNEDVSGEYAVRPDGKISMALSTPIIASGKTTDELAKDIADKLAEFIKDPQVTVIVKNATGNSSEQIRLIGEAVNPVALPFRHGMTVLDLMIQTGGLTTYADGNDAELIRVVNGKSTTFKLRLEDLMKKADMSANVDLQPGDVIRIPESWF